MEACGTSHALDRPAHRATGNASNGFRQRPTQGLWSRGRLGHGAERVGGRGRDASRRATRSCCSVRCGGTRGATRGDPEPGVEEAGGGGRRAAVDQSSGPAEDGSD